ncbi:MAG TPA: hypothetical protein PK854_10180 [Oscillospiraceae bacterium]|nr:hypothetical protein [Oscillospiraceae bacterium]HPS35620.1 hypothetical protein [Oscillospiraceae bacterium]
MSTHEQKVRARVAAVIVAVAVFGALFLVFSYGRYRHAAETEASGSQSRRQRSCPSNTPPG